MWEVYIDRKNRANLRPASTPIEVRGRSNSGRCLNSYIFLSLEGAKKFALAVNTAANDGRFPESN